MRKTEETNLNSKQIDKLGTREILEIINKEDASVALSVKESLTNLALMVKIAIKTIKNGGRVVYMGSGASGDMAINDAQEIPGTYGVDFETFRAIHLQLGPNMDRTKFNDLKNLKRDGSEDGDKQIIKDLTSINFSEKDFLIGISASGTTAVIIKALEWAKKLGATTGAIVMNYNSPMGLAANYEVVAVTGAEVISGSTRMKAATATKMILNALSTTVMIKLGNVYNGLMVGLNIPPEGNLKMQERAIRIISEITQLNKEKSLILFKESNQNIKAAIVMGKKGVAKDEANKILLENDNNLNNII